MTAETARSEGPPVLEAHSLYVGERSSLLFEVDTSVARLAVTRADRGNAIDPQYVADLASCIRRLSAALPELGVRAVLIEAAGVNFSVGGDLVHFGDHLHRLSDELVSMIEPFHEALLTLAELPVPVVAAVQGAVAGGALGLLWAADIIIGSDDLKLVTAFSKLGVSGDGGSSWYLPRLLGQARALELALESPTLDASTALAYGLVTRVVPANQLSTHAAMTVRRLAAGPTRSLGLQRSLIRRAACRELREGLAAELEAMRTSGASRDAAEGMSAFLARRPPTFDNR